MRSRRLTLLVVALAALGLLAYGGVVYDGPGVGEVIRDAPEELGDGTYGFGGLLAFLELSSLLGVPLPCEVGVILSGAVAGEGEISLPPLVVAVWAGATAGESLNFLTGRRFGRPFIVRHGPRLRVTPARLAALEGHFERRGRATVFFGHVIPLVRSSAPFVAGFSLMPYRTFLTWSAAGNVLFALVFCGLGFGFYRSAERVAELAGWTGLLLLVAVVAAVGTVTLVRRRRTRMRAPGAAAAEAQPPGGGAA